MNLFVSSSSGLRFLRGSREVLLGGEAVVTEASTPASKL